MRWEREKEALGCWFFWLGGWAAWGHMTREGETGDKSSLGWRHGRLRSLAGVLDLKALQSSRWRGQWQKLELRLASGSVAGRCQGKPGGVRGVVRSRPRALVRSQQHVGRGSSKEPMQRAEDRPVSLLLFLLIFSNGNSVLFLFKKLKHTAFFFKEVFLPQVTHHGSLCGREAVKVPPASRLLPVIVPHPFLGQGP